MKNLLIFTINLIFTVVLYADINLYYVKDILEVQNGIKFDYRITYEVKSYNFDTGEFSDTDICNACSKPLKLVKAPINKWVIVIEYNLNDEKSINTKKNLIKKIKEDFLIIPIKKDSNNNNILAYYEVKKKLKSKIKKEKKITGIKILQPGNTESSKILIPPNDNFILLKAMAVDEKGNLFKNNDIKITSSCGKLKIKDSSRFSFTFFDNENRCTIYAKLGKYMAFAEVIKLNKDGSIPSKFNIFYKNNIVDKIDIDYYTFKKRGIVLKHNSKPSSVKWIINGKNLKLQILDEKTVIIYPKQRKNKYKIELINLKNSMTKSIEVLIKNEWLNKKIKIQHSIW